MTASGLHVVLGASGGTGAAVVRELLHRGRRVRAVSRRGSPDHSGAVQVVTADVADPDGARRACHDAAVVYHCAAPPYTTWAERFPALTRAITEGAAAAGAKLVLADNLYAYGPVNGPITEDTPQRGTGKKAKVRAAMAEELLAAHAAGRLPVAIGRAADYYGPGGRNSAVGARLFDAALGGRRVRWLGRLDVPHTLSYLEDLARGLVTLGERQEADGQVWHLPAAEALTGREFLELVFAELRRPPNIGVIPPPMIWLGGVFVPMVRELRETSYQWTRPFLVDASKYQQTFGPAAPTPHRQAIARTLAWFRDQAPAQH